MEFRPSPQLESQINDEHVQQMVVLLERLREAHGGELDDSAIQATSEATGVPPEYVRLAAGRLPEKRKTGLFQRIRQVFFALEPGTRSHVLSASLAAIAGMMVAFGSLSHDRTGLFEVLQAAMVLGAAWNAATARDSRIAAISGAIFGGLYVFAASLFTFVFQADGYRGEPAALIGFTFLGAVVGLAIQKVFERNRQKLGIVDPIRERQEMLRQLEELKSKLRAGEQNMTFLSIDIVGSTKIKEFADPLSVEFTFTEYQKYVEMIAKRHGGRIHSTAGDGITCCFDTPQQAFQAAKNIQTGVLELNTFRNKTGVPIRLRCGIHAGEVVTPSAADPTSLNFAHVIDIAAHLQKACPEGGVAVSEAAAQGIAGGPGSIGSERVVAMDVPAVVWMSRSLSMPASSDGPPPLPM